jgi:hypothetical protein
VEIVTGWAAKDRALATSPAEVRAVDGALTAVTEAWDDLARSWRPLAVGFAAQVRAAAGVPAG